MTKKGRERAGSPDDDAVFRRALGDRLRVLLDEYATRADASAVAGVNEDQLFKYLRGESKAPFAVVTRLALDRGYSLEWLASGSGVRKSNEGTGDGFAMIPVWDVEASSGPGMFVGHEETGRNFPMPLSLLARTSVSPSNLCVVFNRGRSNAPDINDGDLMVVEREVSRLVDGAYYLFDEDGALLVKMIERLVGGGVILRSRNPEYDARTLTNAHAEQLHIFGRVRWRIGPI